MAETHVLYGEDSYTLKETFESMRKVVPEEMWDSNVTTLEGPTVTAAALMGAGGVFPFLSPKRLVAVEGFLSKFDPSEHQRGRRGRGEAKVPAEWKKLPDMVKQLPDTTLLVFIDGKEIDRNNPILTMLRPIATVREYPPLRGARLAHWIQEKAKEKKLNLSPSSVNLLASLVGGNLWTMSQEMEKLAAYSQDGRVTEDDIRRLVAQSKEAGIFEMVDAALEGNSAKAIPLMKRLLDDGEAPQRLMATMAGQVRLLLQVKACQSEGVEPEEIGSRLGIHSEFRLSKAVEQARKIPQARLEAAYRKVLDADLRIKHGQLPEDTALYLMVGLI